MRTSFLAVADLVSRYAGLKQQNGYRVIMLLRAHNARGSRLVDRAAKPNVPASRHNRPCPRNNHGRRGHNSRNTVHIPDVRRNTRNTHRIRLNRAWQQAQQRAGAPATSVSLSFYF
jgi:hypothetical protein